MVYNPPAYKYYDYFPGSVNRADNNQATHYRNALIHSVASERESAMYRLKVKEVAEQKRISQRQLFLRSGVDPNTIRRIYRNPQAIITVETLARLARVLSVDVSELIESTPDGN
jgi:DNA-binding Xre family transcriptional regulator